MEKKKLILDHLTAYFAYAIDYIENNRRYSLINLNYQADFEFKGKLILHPLSDLTKEIEVNGERFVPLEKLAKIEFEAERKKFNFNEMPMAGSFPWGNKLRIKIEFGTSLGIVEFGYTQSTHFFYFENYTHKSGFSPCIHNKEMLVKLYEWHFDIHDLIKNNLAIDINTLK